MVVTDFDFNPAWITVVMKFTNAKCFPDLEDAEWDNHLFAEPALDVNPLMLEYADPSIRNDFRLCLKDAKRNREALTFVSEELKGNSEFMTQVDEDRLEW